LETLENIADIFGISGFKVGRLKNEEEVEQIVNKVRDVSLSDSIDL